MRAHAIRLVRAMSEPERQTLGWMRKIDARLDVLGSDVADIKADLAQVRDEVMVTSAICLRLEAREVEAKGLLARYQRLKAGQERLESHVAALEGREPG
jgi:hypothetical protein